MKFNKYDVDSVALGVGAREMMKDNLNAAMELIEINGGPVDVVKYIMRGYRSMGVIAKMKEVGGLEKLEADALVIDEWVEKRQ